MLVVAARPIVLAFGTAFPALAVSFVRVFGVVVLAFSASRTMRGCLLGAGDTRYPLYATVAGMYLFRIPVALLALPVGYTLSLGSVSVAPGLGWGIPAVFVALVGHFYLQATVNVGRYWSGRWRRVASAADLGTGADD